MDIQSFYAVVHKNHVLTENQKKDWYENAPFMLDHERAFAAQEMEKSEEKYVKIKVKVQNARAKAAEQYQEVKLKEIPKLMKTYESAKREQELDEAEKLIDEEFGDDDKKAA